MTKELTAGFTIAAGYVPLIQGFLSTDPDRYYLHGFHVEPHPEQGALIVGTDGHTLGVFHDPNGRCEKPGIVKLSREMVQLCAVERKPPTKAFLEVKGTTATMIVDGNRLGVGHGILIDGTFPDWRKVVPFKARTGAAHISFNARLLKRFEAIALRDGKYRHVELYPGEFADPIIVCIPGRSNFFGVLMPMLSAAMEPVPDWIKQAVNPPKRRKKPAAAKGKARMKRVAKVRP